MRGPSAPLVIAPRGVRLLLPALQSAILQLSNNTRPSLARGQTSCGSYGFPNSLGVVVRPTKPANAATVSRYGNMMRN